MNDESETPQQDEQPTKIDGPELTVDGKLTGPLREAPGEPAPDELPKEEPLELKPQRGPLPHAEPAPYRDVGIPKNPWPMRWVLGLLAAGTVGLVSLVVMGRTEKSLAPHLAKGDGVTANAPAENHPGVVIIDSQPSGASVIIAGRSVGTTPWATDNTYSGNVKFELSLPGYQRAAGSFVGRQDTKVRVTLKAVEAGTAP